MSVKALFTVLLVSLVFSGVAFGQVYQKELESYDLPGLQKKLALIDATIPSEPVTAYFIYNYSQLADRSVAKALAFLQALKEAKADLNMPIRGSDPQSPLVIAVRNRVDYRVVEWLIANGARFGITKTPTRRLFSQDISVIDFAIVNGDYRTAKALIGLDAMLPPKERVLVNEEYMPIVSILKDDLPAVKKRIAETGSDITMEDWEAVIGAGSQKVTDLFLAISDLSPNLSDRSDGAWRVIAPLLVSNPTFLTKLLAKGYSFGDRELVDLYSAAIHEEQFEALTILMAHDKNSVWVSASLMNDLGRRDFDVFRSFTDNFKLIIVPESLADYAEDRVGPYHALFYSDRYRLDAERGIIGMMLKQADPDTIKSILKTIPPTPQEFARLDYETPDDAQKLATLDDSGSLQAMLDNFRKTNQ